MLNKIYKKDLLSVDIQHIVVNLKGDIILSDNTLFNASSFNTISQVHPFFETVNLLLDQENKTFDFRCIHLNLNKTEIIGDIIVKTFSEGKNPLITIVDLTAHYKSYKSIAQSRNESIIHNEYIELKNEYLKQREAFKDIFISNFSKNLRDPISGILTFSGLLDKTSLNKEQLGYLNVIKTSSDYLKQLIDDILDISKIEAKTLRLNIKLTNLHQLLQEVCLTQRTKAETKGIVFIEEFDKNLPEEIEADGFRLKQVLNNIIDNAIKFTNKGNVTFKVSVNQIRAQRANIHFMISDTGKGISDCELKFIFNRLEYNKQLKSDLGNTGLGLSISKYLVEQMGTVIEVDSEVGKGTSFRVDIQFIMPLKSQLKPEVENTIKRVPKGNNEKYSILLADSSELTQVSVLKILANDGNFYVDIVTNGKSAIEKLKENEFDLLLINVDLADVKGDQVVRHLRGLKSEASKIPALALTGELFEKDLKIYKEAGMNAVIKKPFNTDSLLDAIYDNLKKAKLV